jgi:hypothetical protein
LVSPPCVRIDWGARFGGELLVVVSPCVRMDWGARFGGEAAVSSLWVRIDWGARFGGELLVAASPCVRIDCGTRFGASSVPWVRIETGRCFADDADVADPGAAVSVAVAAAISRDLAVSPWCDTPRRGGRAGSAVAAGLDCRTSCRVSVVFDVGVISADSESVRLCLDPPLAGVTGSDSVEEDFRRGAASVGGAPDESDPLDRASAYPTVSAGRLAGRIARGTIRDDASS